MGDGVRFPGGEMGVAAAPVGTIHLTIHPSIIAYVKGACRQFILRSKITGKQFIITVFIQTTPPETVLRKLPSFQNPYTEYACHLQTVDKKKAPKSQPIIFCLVRYFRVYVQITVQMPVIHSSNLGATHVIADTVRSHLI